MKAPHQLATRRQGATPRLATTVAVRPQKPPRERESRHRGGEGTRKAPPPLTHSPTWPTGATAQPAEPEPNPTGRAAEPNVYITHPTHGAGARPGKTHTPTAARKTTPNADQCMHEPREGRGRNRQPPRKSRKKQGGGGTRKAHPHETAHPRYQRRPNPPARRHRGRDPPRDHAAKNRQQQTGSSGPPE